MSATSRGRYPQFNAAARDILEADVGPIEDADTSRGVGPCERGAVFTVPWPSVGGDIDYCHYHLARYRELHPELFERVQEAVDEDLTAFATRGTRFLTLDEIPETLIDEEFVAIALLATGSALYEEADPDETVEYVVVDRRLEEDSRTTVARDHAGEFLRDVEEQLGVHEWAGDALAALNGGRLSDVDGSGLQGPGEHRAEVFEALWRLNRRGERNLLDAVATEAIWPSQGLHLGGICVIEPGTDVEIKSTTVRLTSGQRGRFYIRQSSTSSYSPIGRSTRSPSTRPGVPTSSVSLASRRRSSTDDCPAGATSKAARPLELVVGTLVLFARRNTNKRPTSSSLGCGFANIYRSTKKSRSSH